MDTVTVTGSRRQAASQTKTLVRAVPTCKENTNTKPTVEQLLDKLAKSLKGDPGSRKKTGCAFEELVYALFRAEGHQVLTNQDLVDRDFFKQLEMVNGEAIDGMVKFKGDTYWTLLQIKLTSHPKLQYIYGKFYEDLDRLLKQTQFATTKAMVVTNTKYETKHPNVMVLDYQELMFRFREHPEVFNQVFDQQLAEDLKLVNTDHIDLTVDGLTVTDERRKVIKFDFEQATIIQDTLNHFKEHDRGQVILPCGYGKTLISIKAMVESVGFEQARILFLVPTNYLVNQTADKFTLLYPNSAHMIRRFDGEIEKEKDETRLEALETSLEGRQSYFVISTYQSCRHLDKITFDVAIFDECHRTTGKNSFAALINTNDINRRLFLTATPKHVIIKGEVNGEIFDMADTNQYGEVIAEVSLRSGIDNGRMVPYRVVCFGQLPSVTTNYNATVANICHQAIEEGYSKKIIVFAHKHDQLVEMEVCFKELYRNLKVLRVPEKSSLSQQQKIADDFSKSTEPVVLLNCEVFSQGFDVVSCDSIFFYKGTKSTIKIIQSIGRALRLDPDKPLKRATVLLPMQLTREDVEAEIQAADIEDITDVLKALYTFDKAVVDYLEFKELKDNNGLDAAGYHVKPDLQLDESKLKIIKENIILIVRSAVEDNIFRTIQKEVIDCKFRNEFEYAANKKDYWPSKPEEYLAGKGWKDWSTFLGHKKEDFWSFKDADEAATELMRTINNADTVFESLRSNEPHFPWYFFEVYGEDKTSLSCYKDRRPSKYLQSRRRSPIVATQ